MQTTDMSARKCCFPAFVLLALLLGFQPGLTVAQESIVDWSGTWDSRWRDGGAVIILQQEGARVTGSYPLFEGRIEAQAEGRRLTGRWIEEGRSGHFLFVQSRDGRSFSGRFDTGEWWTGLRAEPDASRWLRVDQSSPMAAMRSFLTAANLASPGNMEMLGTASALLRPNGGFQDGADRFDHARRLFEVLDQVTLRIWDLPQDVSEDVVTVTLAQAGTAERITLDFVREQTRWYLAPPSVPKLEAQRDRLRAARGLVPGPGNPSQPHRLQNPRDTMKSFLAGFGEKRDGSSAQTLATLNLVGIADVAREREAPILAGYLKMVIDRVGYILPQEIPDDPGNHAPYVHFEHPNGNIIIAPVEGEGRVVWQFSPETLRVIRAVYAAIDDMPLAPGLQDSGALNIFFSIRQQVRRVVPSLLLPMGPLERWQWIGLALALVLATGLGLLMARVLLLVETRLGWVNRLSAPAQYLFALWAWRAIAGGVVLLGMIRLLGLPDEFDATLTTVGWLLVVVGSVLLGWQAIGGLARRHAQVDRIGGHNLILLSLATGLLRIALLLGGGLLLAQLLSLPLTGVLAGFGIGGLAVALAAQPTLQNLLAGFTLYADRPVSVGDFCRFGNTSGTVEHIGLRSTRLRTLDRTVISVPNAQFLDMQLENYARRDRRLFQTVLQLRYETTPDQMRYVLAQLRQLLIAHPMVLPDPLRVRFSEFGAHSLDIEVFAYITTANVDEFMAAREDVLLRIMNVVAEAGAQFAFPSVVEYRAEDTPPDRERTAQAEAAVAAWREGENLPFPDFEWQTKAELSNTLDWPPRGSVARPRS
jgi:MscS family membrane protein